jgi:hypothetical protein
LREFKFKILNELIFETFRFSILREFKLVIPETKRLFNEVLYVTPKFTNWYSFGNSIILSPLSPLSPLPPLIFPIILSQINVFIDAVPNTFKFCVW